MTPHPGSSATQCMQMMVSAEVEACTGRRERKDMSMRKGGPWTQGRDGHEEGMLFI